MRSPAVLNKIQANIQAKNYRFRIHALERRIERNISEEEIEEAILNGEIIEDYPMGKYSPSCLILGYTKEGRPLHIYCSIEPVWIVTCYDPSEQKAIWNESFTTRRR